MIFLDRWKKKEVVLVVEPPAKQYRDVSVSAEVFKFTLNVTLVGGNVVTLYHTPGVQVKYGKQHYHFSLEEAKQHLLNSPHSHGVIVGKTATNRDISVSRQAIASLEIVDVHSDGKVEYVTAVEISA